MLEKDSYNKLANVNKNDDEDVARYSSEMRSIEKVHSCLTVCTYIYWYAFIGSIFSIFIGWYPIVVIFGADIKKTSKVWLLVMAFIGLLPIICIITLIIMISIEQGRLRNIRRSSGFKDSLPSMAR